MLKQSPTGYSKVFLDLYFFMKSRNFMGYDPYDFASSPYANNRAFVRNPKLTILCTQALKFLPINVRPILRITEKHNLKTLILTARALLKYFSLQRQDREMERTFDSLVEVVLANAKRKQSGWSWSLIDYDYYSTIGKHGRDTPIIYLTALCGLLFLEAFEYYQNEGYLSVAEKIADFLLSVDVFEKEDSLCYYYTTSLKNRVFNASACACEFLSKMASITGGRAYLDRARKGMNYVVKGQNADGSWDYGTDWSGRKLGLKDFHQGFILDSLYLYSNTAGGNDTYREAIAKGVRFYRSQQFCPSGRSIYRYPRVWPADIHNQAQGIITFRLLEDMFPEHQGFSKLVADWTIEHMYDTNRGYFHYQKWPFLVNMISYMRWNQAWMLFALSHLL